MENVMKKAEVQNAVKRLEDVTRQLMALGASGVFTILNNYQDAKKIEVFMPEKILGQIVGDREQISWDGRDDNHFSYKVTKILQEINFCSVTEKPPKVVLGKAKVSEKTRLCRQAASELFQAVNDVWAFNPEPNRSLYIEYSNYDNEFRIEIGGKVIYRSLVEVAS